MRDFDPADEDIEEGTEPQGWFYGITPISLSVINTKSLTFQHNRVRFQQTTIYNKFPSFFPKKSIHI